MRNRLCAEFTHGKRHGAKYVTGLILLNRHTFLFGDAALGCLDEILSGTNNANDREDAERHGQKSSAVMIVEAKRRIEGSDDRLGKVVFLTAAATVAVLGIFHDLGSKQNGINDLYDRRRIIFLTAVGLGTSAKAIAYVALEHTDVALATIEDDVLFQHGNALKLLRSSTANACLDANLYIKTNGNRKETTVELNGIDPNKGRNDLRTFCTDRRGVLQYFISEIGQIDTNVFKAIAVTTGIQHSVGVDAYRVSAATGRRTGKSVFCHTVYLLYKILREKTLFAIILCASLFSDTNIKSVIER